jgi:hypothetical protein
MQPQRAKPEADIAPVPQVKERKPEQGFEKAKRENNGAIAAPEAANDQLASTRNRFLAAGVS